MPGLEEVPDFKQLFQALAEGRLNIQIPLRLKHEILLLDAEEWLHALRYLNNEEPIAGYKDNEVDVAAYMYACGVQLSDIFLRRYKQRFNWYSTAVSGNK